MLSSSHTSPLGLCEMGRNLLSLAALGALAPSVSVPRVVQPVLSSLIVIQIARAGPPLYNMHTRDLETRATSDWIPQGCFVYVHHDVVMLVADMRVCRTARVRTVELLPQRRSRTRWQ